MGLLESIGGALGLGGGGSSDVKPELVQINPETQEALKKYSKEASETSVGDIASKLQKGVATAPADYSKMVAQKEQALGGYEPGISQAIQNKYKAIAGEHLSGLADQAKMKAFEIKAANLGQASKLQQAKTNIDAQNAQRVQQAEQANARARSSALASILKIGGTIAGAAIGGPTGAAVGGAAGELIGQSKG